MSSLAIILEVILMVTGLILFFLVGVVCSKFLENICSIIYRLILVRVGGGSARRSL